jgi:hypothetical protein
VRRLTLVLGAVLVAACGWGTSNAPSGDVSPTPNRLGQTFIIPTQPPTPDTSVAPADISAWLMVAPIGQGFGVAMPAQPAVTSGSLGTPPLATRFWTYTDPSGQAFQLARSRLPAPPPTLEPRSDEPVPSPSETPNPVDEYQGTVLQSLEGSSFVSGSEANVDGRPGLRYVIQAGSRRSEGLLVLDNLDPYKRPPVLYRVSVTYDADRGDPAAVLGFLDSFTLMSPRAP